MWLAYAVLFGLAAAVRLVFAHATTIPLQGDAAHYVALVHHFLHDGYYGVTDKPDSLRTPGYPLLLAAFSWLVEGGQVSNAAVTALNLIADGFSLWLLLILGKRMGMALALPGILFVALSPFWFGNVNSAVTEPASMTFFLAFLERWTRDKVTNRDLAWAGLYLSALSATRSMFFYFPIGLALYQWGLPWMLAKFRERRTVRRWEAALPFTRQGVAIFLAASLSMPFAWGVRNRITLGEFSMVQSVIGTTMAYTSITVPLMDFRDPELSRQYFALPLVQAADAARSPAEYFGVFDRMRVEVRDFILHHPVAFLQNFWIKFWRLWFWGWSNPYSYLSSAESAGPVYVWVFCVPVVVFGLLGLGAFWRKRFQEPLADRRSAARFRLCGVQLLLILYTTAITAPLIVDSRYSLNAYLLFGLWMGFGWELALGRLFPKAD